MKQEDWNDRESPQTIDLRAVVKIPKVWRDPIHVWTRYSEGWFERETPVMMRESVATS